LFAILENDGRNCGAVFVEFIIQVNVSCSAADAAAARFFALQL
jgi:hypothetical protein